MLHLLNSHKKYQLKYCDFGRNIGNLRGDSSSVSFLHLQPSAVPAWCLWGKGGLRGRCHAPLRLHRRGGRSPFPPPAPCRLFLVWVGTRRWYRDDEALRTQSWSVGWRRFGMVSLPSSVGTARGEGKPEILQRFAPTPNRTWSIFFKSSSGSGSVSLRPQLVILGFTRNGWDLHCCCCLHVTVLVGWLWWSRTLGSTQARERPRVQKTCYMCSQNVLI